MTIEAGDGTLGAVPQDEFEHALAQSDKPSSPTAMCQEPTFNSP
jgi:hypothetical protein